MSEKFLPSLQRLLKFIFERLLLSDIGRVYSVFKSTPNYLYFGIDLNVKYVCITSLKNLRVFEK